jgi:hypothetical protein
MMYTILTSIVLIAAPAAEVKETGTVSWQYYAGEMALGAPVPPAGTKPNIRCSVIASDADGDWVCLYVDAIPKSTIPDGKNAEACRPLAKDGKPFKLTNAALRPDSDTTQVVAFVSNSQETTYKLVVKTDGSISFGILRPTFAGDTKMSGAASMCWYVSKKK